MIFTKISFSFKKFNFFLIHLIFFHVITAQKALKSSWKIRGFALIRAALFALGLVIFVPTFENGIFMLGMVFFIQSIFANRNLSFRKKFYAPLKISIFSDIEFKCKKIFYLRFFLEVKESSGGLKNCQIGQNLN